jgi:hypothetical protein
LSKIAEEELKEHIETRRRLLEEGDEQGYHDEC